MDNKQPLSDAEIQAYVAADAALTTTKPWKLEVTSRRMKLYAFLAAGITLAIHIFLAIVVAIGNTGTAVTSWSGLKSRKSARNSSWPSSKATHDRSNRRARYRSPARRAYAIDGAG